MMDAVGLFLTGLFFGLCLGVAVMALRKTCKELDDVNREIAETKQNSKVVKYEFINYDDDMTDEEFERFLFGGKHEQRFNQP